MSPQYVGIVDAVKLFFTNYVNFKGRSTRSEYWWVALALGVVGCILYGIFAATQSSFFGLLYCLLCLGTIVPSISLSFRRLHDIGKPGYWILIGLVPLVGGIILLIFTIKPSEGANQWGEPAKN